MAENAEIGKQCRLARRSQTEVRRSFQQGFARPLLRWSRSPAQRAGGDGRMNFLHENDAVTKSSTRKIVAPSTPGARRYPNIGSTLCCSAICRTPTARAQGL